MILEKFFQIDVTDWTRSGKVAIVLVVGELTCCEPSLGVSIGNPDWVGSDTVLSDFDFIGVQDLAIASIEGHDVSVELRGLVHVESFPLFSCFNVDDIFLELSNVLGNRD